MPGLRKLRAPSYGPRMAANSGRLSPCRGCRLMGNSQALPEPPEKDPGRLITPVLAQAVSPAMATTGSPGQHKTDETDFRLPGPSSAGHNGCTGMVDMSAAGETWT